MDDNKELENRIEAVRKGTDEIPRMTKKDYAGALIFAGICLIIVILGGIFL